MKTAYAAHLIHAVRYKDHVADSIPLYENVVLIYADSDDEAQAAAEERGRADPLLDEDHTFTWGGRPAYWEFVGVRKLITCQPDGFEDDIGPGAELTYSQMRVKSEDDLKRLVEGEPVEVVYEE